MHDDETTFLPKRARTPAPPRRDPFEPLAGVTVSGIDVPFGQLTLFFVKASLSMALALTLTSAVWVLVGGIVAGIALGGWLAVSALFGPARVPVAAGTPPAVEAPVASAVRRPAVARPEPPPEPEAAAEPAAAPAAAAAPAPAPEAARALRPAAVSESDAATDAMLKAELEAMRQRKGR